MAKIVLRFYTTLKDIAKTGRVEVEAETVADALQSAVAKFGPKFSESLLNGEKSKCDKLVVRNCFVLVVNSQMIGLKGLERKELKDGDMLHIFPPIAGGAEVKNG